MKQLFAFLFASALFLGTGPVFAQTPEDEDLPQAPDPKPLIGRMKLTDQQKKQVEQMRFDMEKQLVGVRAKMQTARLDLRQLLAADNPDKAAIETKMGEISQVALQVHSIRLNEWFEVNKILNPDQQKVWKEMLKHPLRDRVRGWANRRSKDGGCPCMHGPMMGGRGDRERGQRGMMMEHQMPEKEMEHEGPEKK